MMNHHCLGKNSEVLTESLEVNLRLIHWGGIHPGGGQKWHHFSVKFGGRGDNNKSTNV